MTEDHQIDFTVSPYDDSAAVAEPPESAGRRGGFSVRTVVAAGLWAVAAVLAVVANFFEVYRLRYDGSVADNSPNEHVSLSYTGWGQHHFSASDPQDSIDSLAAGARWGWLFTAAAVLLLVAAAWSLWPRLRFRLAGPAELALAAVFGLAGAAGALVLSFQPTRHQLDQRGSPTLFHWGWCWQLELAAAALGLLGWFWYPRPEQARTELAGTEHSPAATQFLAGDDVRLSSWDEAEPGSRQTENWLDGPTDRPHIPRDSGPSPW